MKYQDDTLAEVLAEMAEVWVRAGRGEIGAHDEPFLEDFAILLRDAIDRELSCKRETP